MTGTTVAEASRGGTLAVLAAMGIDQSLRAKREAQKLIRDWVDLR